MYDDSARLPLLDDQAGGSPPAPAAPESRPLVLIVDDEAMLRELATRTLERGGFRVCTAAHGKAAIGLLETRGSEVGLVVLDLTMPGLSGEETFAIIRARWPAVRIMLSSGQHSDAMASLQEKGQVTFIEKPYMPYELLTAVQGALAG